MHVNPHTDHIRDLVSRLKLALKETSRSDEISVRADTAVREAVAFLLRELDPKPHEIERCLTLNLRHLRPEDRDMLDCDAPAPGLHIACGGDHAGAICYANPDLLRLPHQEFNYDEGGWSPEFHECLRYAARLGCYLVRFDGDGPEVPDLPTFTY